MSVFLSYADKPAHKPFIRHVCTRRRDADLEAEWRAIWARRGRQMQARDKASWERGRQQATSRQFPGGRGDRAVEARRRLVEQAVAVCRTTNDAWRLSGLPKATFHRYLQELRQVDVIIAACGKGQWP